MPAADVSRAGLKAGGSDPLELFLTKFTGEVLSKFNVACKFQGKNYTRSIAEGKAARFDVMGGAKSRYRTIGENLAESAQQVAADQFTIALDGMLIAHALVDEFDDLLNHYDVRSKYAEKLALALAERYDRNIAVCGLKAARASSRIPGGDGGTVLAVTNGSTDANALVNGIYQACQVLDEKNVAETGRWIFVRPSIYYMLAQNLDLINTLYGGTGSVKEGEVIKIAGFTLVKTNHLPNTAAAAQTDEIAKYVIEAENTVALCMNEEAVGTVKRMSLTSSADWLPEYKSWLLSAEYLMGHDYLRPECAVEIQNAVNSGGGGGSGDE
jgi:hypothetical protein